MTSESRCLDVIVVCRPEDVATEFLSVLDRDTQAPVQVVIAAEGSVAPLAPGRARDRLAALATCVRAATHQVSHLEASADVAGLVGPLLDGGATVWTHCPADERRDRARVGWLTALACQGRTVLYAVGVSSHFQFVTDVTVQLSADQVELKLQYLHDHAAAQVRAWTVATESVAACERFFTLPASAATHLYALLHSVEEEASLAVDPWCFRASHYERERLRRTAAWVSRHVAPGSGRVVEVGSCEGALTELLLASGHTLVASEPNGRFHQRMREAVTGRADVTADSLEELARKRQLSAAAYLLIEMLYYVDDLSVIDALPTNVVMLAVNSEELRERVDPWLAAGQEWDVADTCELVAPRVDFVCGRVAYRRKQGSVGLLCLRRRQLSPS